MIENFLTVAQQVLVLFLLIGVGFLLEKKKLLKEEAVKGLTDIVLLFVTPCVIIKSFMRDYDASLIRSLGVATLAALLIHVGSIGIACLVFRRDEDSRRPVLRVGTVFSNSGFMALPLQEALLGDIGVFYGAAYIAVFNLVLWSYALFEMSGEKPVSPRSVRKLFLNPGVIGLVLGMAVFLLPYDVPVVIAAPIKHLAALNTPLPMMIIGYYLAGTDFKKALKDGRSYIAIGLRTLGIPLLTLLLLWACGIRGTLLVACVVATSAPTAAATTMFAAKFHRDTNLSVNMVSLSTVFSLITMPVVVGLAQMVS